MSDTGWTPARVDTLKSLWLGGLSASLIAKALGGVTRNAVIGKVHRLGLGGRVAGGVRRGPRHADRHGRRRYRSGSRSAVAADWPSPSHAIVESPEGAGPRLPPRARRCPRLPVADR